MNDSLISSSIRRGRMRSRLFGAVMTRLHSAGETAEILGEFPSRGIYPNGGRKAIVLRACKPLCYNILRCAFRGLIEGAVFGDRFTVFGLLREASGVPRQAENR